MTGIIANSASLPAVSWEASFVKTATINMYISGCQAKTVRTQARCEQQDVEIGSKLLHFCVEHALAGDDVAGKADAYNLHNRFKHQEYQMAESRVGRMWRDCLVPEHRERSLSIEHIRRGEGVRAEGVVIWEQGEGIVCEAESGRCREERHD